MTLIQNVFKFIKKTMKLFFLIKLVKASVILYNSPVSLGIIHNKAT